MSMAQSRHREKFGGEEGRGGKKKKGFLPSSTEAKKYGGRGRGEEKRGKGVG